MKLYVFEDGVGKDDSIGIAFSIANSKEEAIKNILNKHLNYANQIVEKYHKDKKDYNFWKEYYTENRQQSLEYTLNNSSFIELELTRNITYFDGEFHYKKELKI